MGRYASIFFIVNFITIGVFYFLGFLGLLNNTDGMVIYTTLLLTIQLAIIISGLVYVIDLIKRKES
jgi:hypothetical protein